LSISLFWRTDFDIYVECGGYSLFCDTVLKYTEEHVVLQYRRDSADSLVVRIAFVVPGENTRDLLGSPRFQDLESGITVDEQEGALRLLVDHKRVQSGQRVPVK
jgi:hypothetical protein